MDRGSQAGQPHEIVVPLVEVTPLVRDHGGEPVGVEEVPQGRRDDDTRGTAGQRERVGRLARQDRDLPPAGGAAPRQPGHPRHLRGISDHGLVRPPPNAATAGTSATAFTAKLTRVTAAAAAVATVVHANTRSARSGRSLSTSR